MQFGVQLQVLFWDAVWGAVGGASDGAGARGRVLFGTLFGGVLLEVLVCNHCYLGSMLVFFYFYFFSRLVSFIAKTGANPKTSDQC